MIAYFFRFDGSFEYMKIITLLGLLICLGASAEETCQSNLTNQKSWPNNRSLARYNELTNIEIQTVLERGQSWLEVGPGTNTLPMREVLENKQIFAYSMGPTKPTVGDDNILHIKGKIPEDLDKLSSLYGKMDLVTDIFAAITYSGDPLKAILVESHLLKSDGLLIAVTESNLISPDTIMIEFKSFMKELGFDINFEVFHTIADSSGKPELNMRMRVKKTTNTTSHKNDVATAVRKFDSIFKAKTSQVILWKSGDHQHKIMQVKYEILI